MSFFFAQQEIDNQPLFDSNIFMFIYFVIFIVFGVLICANLIAGLLVKQISSVGCLNDVFASSKKSKNEAAIGSNDMVNMVVFVVLITE